MSTLTCTLWSGNAGKSSFLDSLFRWPPTACELAFDAASPGGPLVVRLLLLLVLLLMLATSTGAGDELSIRENRLAWAACEKFCCCCGWCCCCCCCCCCGSCCRKCDPTAAPRAGNSEGSNELTCCCRLYPILTTELPTPVPLISRTAACANDWGRARFELGESHNTPLLFWPA